ncbi:MAG: site-specific integrase [Candidatus Aminicenantes bacterium]|jgi:integrase
MPDMEKGYTIENRLENLINEVKNTELHTPENKKQILKFVNTCRAKNLTAYRICFYLGSLKMIARVLKKDFKSWSRKDVEYVMGENSRKGYSSWTMENIKTTLKVIFRWINDLEKSDPAPKIVRWLSRENIPSRIRREDLLTRKDLEDLLRATNNPMYKALISVLNAGARPGEILGIRLKDITQINGLIKIYVYGKMGRKMGERPLYIIELIDEFKAWVRRHPQKHDLNAKLFTGKSGDLKYFAMNKIVERLALRAGIMRYKRDEIGNIIRNRMGRAEVEGKRVWLYLFRHTAGTRYYGKYEGSYARRLMGHASGSKMEAVYCHLNEEDIEARLLGKSMPDGDEPDIPTVEKETEELVNLGKAIKKLAEAHPEVIDIEKLQGLLGQ